MQRRARASASNPMTVAAARRAAPRIERSLVHLRQASAAFRVHQPGRPPSREAPSAMPNAARTRAAATRTAALGPSSRPRLCEFSSTLHLRPSLLYPLFLDFPPSFSLILEIKDWTGNYFQLLVRSRGE